MPPHIKARWALEDDKFVVSKLFSGGAAANVNLRDVHLTGLKKFVGATEYTKVKIKSHSNEAPNLGLDKLFAQQEISGRIARARQKGMMFFYLMCRHPEQVKWPEFAPHKRCRATSLSLAEIGRLVAILADPQNTSIVSMILREWTRAELDAKAGKKGVAYYWDQLAQLFNNTSYVPAENTDFADHVTSCGTEARYSTGLVPEYRNGDQLRTKWTALRSSYALFHSRFNKSGHNSADPTMFTTDLHVLLMHYTFHDTPYEAWAAKSMLDGAVDDAGDGGGGSVKTAKRRKKSVHFSIADHVIATTTVYDTLANADRAKMTEQEIDEHKVRFRRASKLMDACLDKLEDM